VDPDLFNQDLDTGPEPAFQVNPDPDTDPGFWWLKSEKKYSWKFLYFLIFKLQFIYPYAYIKGVQATQEALRPQKRTYSTLDPQHCMLVIRIDTEFFSELVSPLSIGYLRLLQDTVYRNQDRPHRPHKLCLAQGPRPKVGYIFIFYLFGCKNALKYLRLSCCLSR
jgi:hypothetical protein